MKKGDGGGGGTVSRGVREGLWEKRSGDGDEEGDWGVDKNGDVITPKQKGCQSCVCWFNGIKDAPFVFGPIHKWCQWYWNVSVTARYGQNAWEKAVPGGSESMCGSVCNWVRGSWWGCVGGRGVEGRGRGASNKSWKQMHHDLPSPPRHTVTTVEDEMVLRRARWNWKKENRICFLSVAFSLP